MTEKPGTVTPERFVSGFTYQDYTAQVKVNKSQFEKYYATGQLSAEDVQFFRKASQAPNGMARMLVLGEDWCPDVFRGLPVIARIAEAAGIELRMFPRDQNLDIMNEFLNQGKFMSMPVAVFYTKDLRYIGHWIERPASANRERTQIEADVRKEKPQASEQEAQMVIRERLQARYPAWQQESIREMRQMLSEKLGL
ncbi:MAG: thioredoxin family protein [Dehalococcoidales bacterium]|nr:thioredoxin family protein [Dehalococcoidales bacterium]